MRGDETHPQIPVLGLRRFDAGDAERAGTDIAVGARDPRAAPSGIRAIR